MDNLLSTKEAAKIAKTTPESLARSCRAGTIPAVKIGLVWMIKREDLEAYMKRKPRRGSPKVQNTPSEDYLSLVEAAQIAGVTSHTLNVACRRGTLPAQKTHYSWRIRRSDLEHYLANKPKGGRPRKNPKP
jgi:excisionase family DNA binding protein